MQVKLKPCPFCSGEPSSPAVDTNGYCYIFCMDCGATVKSDTNLLNADSAELVANVTQKWQIRHGKFDKKI